MKPGKRTKLAHSQPRTPVVNALQPRRSNSPKAPAVYRPQPVPKVLQTKRAPGPAVGAPQSRKPPVAAPAHRQPGKIVQPKSNVRVAGPNIIQRSRVPNAPQRNPVVQLMQQSWQAQHYVGYWPPSNTPPDVPPTPSGQYYDEGATYWAKHGDMDAFDEFLDQYGSYTNTTVGQTFGTQENEDYDASYVDIPSNLRPSAPNAKSLWNTVYGGLAQDPTNNSFLRVACAEKSDGYVRVDSVTKKEEGTSKKPPMCHIVAFKHISWAADFIHLNRSHAWFSGVGKYKGPNPTQYPNDTWKALVWDISNLQPGHSKCNSQTAHLAVGPLSSSNQKAAVAYVAVRLKALEPTWF
jgi:hypothetical protein